MGSGGLPDRVGGRLEWEEGLGDTVAPTRGASLLGSLFGAQRRFGVDRSHPHRDTVGQELYKLLDLTQLAVALPGSSTEKLEQLQTSLFCHLQEGALGKLWAAAPAFEDALHRPSAAGSAVKAECDELLDRLLRVLLPLGDPETACAYVAGGDGDSNGESLLAQMSREEAAEQQLGSTAAPAMVEAVEEAEAERPDLLGDMGMKDFFDSEDDQEPRATTTAARAACEAAAPAAPSPQPAGPGFEYAGSLKADSRHVLCILLHPDMRTPQPPYEAFALGGQLQCLIGGCDQSAPPSPPPPAGGGRRPGDGRRGRRGRGGRAGTGGVGG